MPKEKKCKICGLSYTMGKEPDMCAEEINPEWWPDNPYSIRMYANDHTYIDYNKTLEAKIWQEASDACAKAVREHLGKSKMETRKKLNVYTCQACGRYIVTIERVEGVTPFMIGCEKSEDGCGGDMHSSFYDVDQSLKPTHEWYRPSSVEHYPKEHRDAMQDHIDNGGLDIKPIKD